MGGEGGAALALGEGAGIDDGWGEGGMGEGEAPKL